jgi:hypothetical protein
MISSPDVTRYHTANFIKQRGVIPTEIYILKHNFFLQDQSIRGKLFSIETRTWYPHHFFKTLGPASSIMVQSSALSLYLPHYKLLIRWCSCGVSRSEHGAKVHDNDEEHRISHHNTAPENHSCPYPKYDENLKATRGTAIDNLVGPTWKGLRESFSCVYPGPA